MARLRTLLLLDWDGTVTNDSTLPLVAEITSRRFPTQWSTSQYPFSYFSNAWQADYVNHVSRCAPSAIHRRDPQAELEWLGSISVVEEASVRRLEGCGLWRGVTGPDGSDAADPHPSEQRDSGPQNDIEAAAAMAVKGGRVRLRPGLGSLLAKVYASNGAVAVISVNWSAAWIAYVLTELGFPAESAAIAKAKAGAGGKSNKSVINVYANDIDPRGSGMLSRGLPILTGNDSDESPEPEFRFDGKGRGIWTAYDKAAATRLAVADSISGTSLVPSLGHGRGVSGKAPSWSGWQTVYVGDSCTDLACLLDSDIAICISDHALSENQRELAETLERIAIPCSSISEYKNTVQIEAGEEAAETASGSDEGKKIWRARDLDEIHNALFGANINTTHVGHE